MIKDNDSIIKKLESDMNNLKEKNKELEKLVDEQKQEIDDYIFKLNNLSENNQVFMVNANRILRFKTLEENKIKSNDIISLFTIE